MDFHTSNAIDFKRNEAKCSLVFLNFILFVKNPLVNDMFNKERIIFNLIHKISVFRSVTISMYKCIFIIKIKIIILCENLLMITIYEFSWMLSRISWNLVKIIRHKKNWGPTGPFLECHFLQILIFLVLF